MTRRNSQRPVARPRALSRGEETFLLHCRAYGLHPERETHLIPGRNWSFDFWFPDQNIAVEIEGATAFGKSRHSRGAGFEEDCRKYNAAAMAGVTLLRFSTKMVESGEAIDLLRSLLGGNVQRV